MEEESLKKVDSSNSRSRYNNDEKCKKAKDICIDAAAYHYLTAQAVCLRFAFNPAAFVACSAVAITYGYISAYECHRLYKTL